MPATGSTKSMHHSVLLTPISLIPPQEWSQPCALATNHPSGVRWLPGCFYLHLTKRSHWNRAYSKKHGLRAWIERQHQLEECRAEAQEQAELQELKDKYGADYVE
jgi:hypothetical protein